MAFSVCVSLKSKAVPMNFHESVFVASGAQITGDVTIGADSSVWHCAVLRGDEEPIIVGERSNIQDGCVLHCSPGMPLIVGNDVLIGHGVNLHGCTVEDGSLVGIGAIVLDGARIGAGSLVAAGSLVPPGMQVPPGSMVMGSPARVRRMLTAEEQAKIIEDCKGYMRMAKKAKSKQ
jgi:carbonic anhydrase/acetyltransferase-like protein (isoleucine patch superfamily)